MAQFLTDAAAEIAVRAAAQPPWGGRGHGLARLASDVRSIDTPAGRFHVVRLEFRDSAARAVAIIGDFNRWRSGAAPMVQVDRGRWMRILFLPPGRYEYLLVVDGRCVRDPGAKEAVPNAYGLENSVLTVPDRSDFQPMAGAVDPPPPPRSESDKT